MIPVENAAGGAAAGAHEQPEGAPDQHADQVAHIEQRGDQKQLRPPQDAAVVQRADDGQTGAPDQEDLVGGFGGGDDVVAQRLVVDPVADGLEAAGEELHGAQGELVLDGHDLLDGIHSPNQPQQVQPARLPEEAPALQNTKFLRTEGIQHKAQRQHDAPADEPEDISLSRFGHRKSPLFQNRWDNFTTCRQKTQPFAVLYARYSK